MLIYYFSRLLLNADLFAAYTSHLHDFQSGLVLKMVMTGS